MPSIALMYALDQWPLILGVVQHYFFSNFFITLAQNLSHDSTLLKRILKQSNNCEDIYEDW